MSETGGVVDLSARRQQRDILALAELRFLNAIEESDLSDRVLDYDPDYLVGVAIVAHAALCAYLTVIRGQPAPVPWNLAPAAYCESVVEHVRAIVSNPQSPSGEPGPHILPELQSGSAFFVAVVRTLVK